MDKGSDKYKGTGGRNRKELFESDPALRIWNLALFCIES